VLFRSVLHVIVQNVYANFEVSDPLLAKMGA